MKTKKSAAKSKKSGETAGKQQKMDLRKLSSHSKGRIWDLILVLVCGISALCFVACFSESLWWLDKACSFLFGYLRYGTPFLAIAVAFLLRFADKTWTFYRKAISLFLIFFAISGLCWLFTRNSANVIDYPGGLLGLLNQFLLRKAFGDIGSYIINILFILIGVIFFSDFSIFEYLGKRYHEEKEIHNRKAEFKMQELEMNQEEKYKQRLKEAETSFQEKRKKQNEARFQPIYGIGDTTIRENEGPVKDNTLLQKDRTQPLFNQVSLPDIEEDDVLKNDVESLIIEHENKEKPFVTDIKIPKEFFEDFKEENQESPVPEEEKNFFIEPDSEEVVPSGETFTKKVITANGKVMEVETDGDILSKKLAYGGSTSSSSRESTSASSPENPENPEIRKPEQPPLKEYRFPPMRLLHKGSSSSGGREQIQQEIKYTADRLQQTLKTFGVNVTITHVSYGPSVTRYEIQPELGVKVSKILSLTDDIKLSLAAADVRIEAPIPGKSAIGIEVPNKTKQGVVLHDLLNTADFSNARSVLSFGLGKDIDGNTVIADIEKMPHVLVAGTTGSGKSVCINSMIMSILYHAKPTEVKMILVDPKVVEFSVYNGIPHLLLPVVTDPKKAASALNWAVAEMERRYERFAEFGVRGVEGFNTLVETDQIEDQEGNPLEKMPQILIIIDELADLMMVAANEVEAAICRLAQKARAAGMHLVLATQRPSVDVITGLIKANIPSRIALSVSSGVDSRTILDMNGAEKLLGHGDMLYDPQGATKPLRVQGAFVSDEEINEVVNYILAQGPVQGMTLGKTVDLNAPSGAKSDGSEGDARDDYFVESAYLIIEKQKASIGMLQRAFKLGFNRAARIMDQLCEAGVVGEEEGTKPRKILMNAAQFEDYLNSQE